MTPMMEQYFQIKNQYKDFLLFYRVGDFYEMFYDDAKAASAAIDLTLTGKDCGEPERAPMCGVPFHAADTYIAKLIAKGTDDVDIKIGTENEYKQLANSSVIISHYDINGERSGALGIIGPTRLNYAKLIPYMQFVSGLVGKILTETLEE